jgi:phage terminase large subunit-like protein
VHTRYDGEVPIICPQPGPQEMFLSTTADIAFYGGAAYGGKTIGELLEGLRNVGDPLYTGKIFRRKYKEIVDGGGLWDSSLSIYPLVGGVGVRGSTEWTFPSGCKIKFDHLNQEKNMLDHQGVAYVYLAFDELTHFTKAQFFYLLSRNRPPAGCFLRPYCRATFNAEPGWVADMIAWYWDPETGYPIKERSGIIRHFIRKKTTNPNDDDILWVSPDYRDEEGNPPYSFTFISAAADDNPLGLLADPAFKSRMKSMDHVTYERLMGSNFLISFGGNMFRAEWFDIIEPDEVPKDLKRVVRYWDMAASEVTEEKKNDPDWTAGVSGTIYNDVFYILDANFFRKVPGEAEEEMKRTAKVDGNSVEIWWEEEKGSSGKYTSEYFKQVFKGYDCHPDPVSGQKVERAKPWSAWAYNGRVKLVRGAWNRQFISWATQFPESKRDTVDSTSGCFKVLIQPNRVLSYYVADESDVGNRALFKRDREAFDKITKGNIDVYVVLWSEDNGSIYAGFYIWSHVSKRLRIYNELIDVNPVPGLLARRIKELVVVPMTDNPQTVCMKRIYCNDTMHEYGKGSMAKELKKHGIRLHKNTLYDENGAILTANALFSENSIKVHSDLTDTDTHIRGWQYDDNKKPKKGYPLAKCLCLLLSQLKEDKVQLIDHTPKPYSKSKMNIRNELRSRMSVPGNAPVNEDKQHEYLAK